MPTLKKIRFTMINHKIDHDIMKQMDFEADGNNPYDVISLIDKMDELLTKDQCLSIMEKQGCCKSGQRDKDCKGFAKEHGNKPLYEKLELLSSIRYMMSPQLNDDGTITITFGNFSNGVYMGEHTCSCGVIKKLKQPFSVSPTYCGCCAGHFLYHYQNALGVKLKLKEINSSPLNTNGVKPCSFTFEVIE
ncbi:MAG: hypothetical protein PHG08_09185 [Bacilli bacterium]|nr:hypothetical protein [Bacilli bacterium]HHX70796.1 hypothetical protein [Gallicola sp.]